MRESSTRTSRRRDTAGLGTDRFPGAVGRSARARRQRPPQQPLLVTKEEAARALGMSISHFQRHVQLQIKCVYSGQLSLYNWRDLERWVEDEATVGGRRV